MTKRLLDVNLLIGLTHAGHEQHLRAHKWFAEVKDWCTTPVTESGFIRLTMNPVVVGASLTFPMALGALNALRGLPGHSFLPDNTSFSTAKTDCSGIVGYRQVTDCHLVELARANHAVLATLDARIRAALVPSDQHLVEIV